MIDKIDNSYFGSHFSITVVIQQQQKQKQLGEASSMHNDPRKNPSTKDSQTKNKKLCSWCCACAFNKDAQWSKE